MNCCQRLPLGLYVIDIQNARHYGVTWFVSAPNLKNVPGIIREQFDYVVYECVSDSTPRCVDFNNYLETNDPSLSKIAVTKLFWPSIKNGFIIDKLRGVVHNIPSMKSVQDMFFQSHSATIQELLKYLPRDIVMQSLAFYLSFFTNNDGAS